MKFSIMRSIDTKRYPSLIGQSIEDLETLSTSLGEPSFRGRQLFDWIYRKKVDDFTNTKASRRQTTQQEVCLNYHLLSWRKLHR